MINPGGIAATTRIIDTSRSSVIVTKELFILNGTNFSFPVRVDAAIGFVYSTNESSISLSILSPSRRTLVTVERYNNAIRQARSNDSHGFASIGENRTISADESVTPPHLDSNQYDCTCGHDNRCNRKTPLEHRIKQKFAKSHGLGYPSGALAHSSFSAMCMSQQSTAISKSSNSLQPNIIQRRSNTPKSAPDAKRASCRILASTNPYPSR